MKTQLLDFLWTKLKASQAAKNRADKKVIEKVIEDAVFHSYRPINAESFRSVYSVLERSLEKKYRILAEVSLGSFLKTDNESAFHLFNCKRVDFLIISPSGAPILAIEYHGSGHFQGDAESRDAVKRLVFLKAGIPLLEFKAGVSADHVKDEVMKNLGEEKRGDNYQ